MCKILFVFKRFRVESFVRIRVRLKRGSGYGTERMRNGTERIWRNGTDMGLKCGTERNGYGVKMRNGTERIWG